MARLVLVVDDEPLVLDVAARMLEDLGCDVVIAADAEEALETLADLPVEILITDVNMPGMDGYELANAAVKMRTDLKVIVLSGGARDGRGFPFIQKPFRQADLKEAIARNTGPC